jgi:hypothetical protein
VVGTDVPEIAGPATSTVNLAIAPTVAAGSTAIFEGGGNVATLDAGIAVSDQGPTTTLVGAAVSIASGFLPGDTLNFINQGGIAGSYDAVHGVMTLSGSASLVEYQAALRSITYSFTPANGDPTGDGTDTSRGISWVVNDGIYSSTLATSSLSVAASVASIVDESFASPAGTDNDAGKTVTFAIDAGAPVIVSNGGNGLPTLQLNDSETATYSGAVGSTVNSLVFTYTVQPGDIVAGLKATSFNALPANTTIQDVAGNNINLGGFTAIDTRVEVDTTAPTVSSITLAGSSPSDAGSDAFTVTFSEAVSGVVAVGLRRFLRQRQRSRHADAQFEYRRVRTLRHRQQCHHGGDPDGPGGARMVGQRRIGRSGERAAERAAQRPRCRSGKYRTEQCRHATRPGDGVIRAERRYVGNGVPDRSAGRRAVGRRRFVGDAQSRIGGRDLKLRVGKT